jgi:hypothetical protein
MAEDKVLLFRKIASPLVLWRRLHSGNEEKSGVALEAELEAMESA